MNHLGDFFSTKQDMPVVPMIIYSFISLPIFSAEFPLLSTVSNGKVGAWLTALGGSFLGLNPHWKNVFDKTSKGCPDWCK